MTGQVQLVLIAHFYSTTALKMLSTHTHTHTNWINTPNRSIGCQDISEFNILPNDTLAGGLGQPGMDPSVS